MQKSCKGQFMVHQNWFVWYVVRPRQISKVFSRSERLHSKAEWDSNRNDSTQLLLIRGLKGVGRGSEAIWPSDKTSDGVYWPLNPVLLIDASVSDSRHISMDSLYLMSQLHIGIWGGQSIKNTLQYNTVQYTNTMTYSLKTSHRNESTHKHLKATMTNQYFGYNGSNSCLCVKVVTCSDKPTDS